FPPLKDRVWVPWISIHFLGVPPLLIGSGLRPLSLKLQRASPPEPWRRRGPALRSKSALVPATPALACGLSAAIRHAKCDHAPGVFGPNDKVSRSTTEARAPDRSGSPPKWRCCGHAREEATAGSHRSRNGRHRNERGYSG